MSLHKKWRISLFFFLVTIGGSACDGDPPEKEETELVDAVVKAPLTEPEKQLPVEPQIVVSDVPLLAHGTHMVYGIRLPRGMMPMKQSGNTQRFEGTHSIASVKKYLVAQLAGNVQMKPTQYGKGYFISSAFTKSAQADLSRIDLSRKKYNIKIFEGSLGGAAVEIWEAKPGEQYVAQAPEKNGSYGSMVGPTVRKKKAAVPKIKYESKHQRVKATFRTMDKLAKGQPLAEEDYQSPYFTDL